MKLFYLFSFGLLMGIHSCRTAEALSEMKKEQARVYRFTYRDKEISFIPMHHVGKQGFYDDVGNQVAIHKVAGYRVYYELISKECACDSLENDRYRRKLRKILGGGLNYKERFEQAGVFKNYIQQPDYRIMNTDSSDVRADIDIRAFIDEWEKVNSPIILNRQDSLVPLDKPFDRNLRFTWKEFDRVASVYRTNVLLDMVKSSASKKILVLYGKGHLKLFREGLAENKN